MARSIRLLPLLSALAVLFLNTPAFAQGDPPMPPPLQALVEEGAQARYLGREYGLDGWITIRNGEEQYFYVTTDGRALLMGLLFDRDGKAVTVRQVKELQDKAGGVLDSFAVKEPATDPSKISPTSTAFKTPAEQLYDNAESSNWIALGKDGAPVIYSFMDPQCPHCHDFMEDLRKDYIDTGLLQLRVIPVGLREDTRAQAAYLLAAPDPAERWYRHLAGDKTALPVEKGINEQGVERNLAIMQSWKLDATPTTVYRDAKGQVKIVRGRARNVGDILHDLGRK